MAEYIIYHNPRCSKSRETLNLLEEAGVNPTVVEYLKNPLSKSEVLDLLEKFGGEPQAFVRTKEAVFKENDIAIESKEQIAEAITNHPVLMERPLVVKGSKAVFGRPPENVRELL